MPASELSEFGQDVLAAADAAGLSYCTDDEPGIVRIRCGRGFRFLDPERKPVNGASRARIKDLVIPPAWTDVWISSDPNSHLQATGRDDLDRKQYLYHPRWREVRDEAKFEQLGAFAASLTEIRKQVAADLAQSGVGKRRVTAAVVRLLDSSLIRVGNERYAAENETFGATTLEQRHVKKKGDGYRLDFSAKSGVERVLDVDDPDVVAIIRSLVDLRQKQLFCYEHDCGSVSDLTSVHVNDYLNAAGGPDVTAKAFRTWGGTVLAVRHLCTATDLEIAVEKRCLQAIDAAAEGLGNTRAVCRSSYVAPAVIVAAETGELAEAWKQSRSGRWRTRAESTTSKVV